MQESDGTPSDVFRLRLKALRQSRGWSAQDLADAVAVNGGSMSRGTIAKIETATRGSRGVTLDEALELAVALNTPLPMLMLPIGTGERIAVAPGREVDTWTAWDWISGSDPLDPLNDDIDAWQSSKKPIDTYGVLRQARVRVSRASGDLQQIVAAAGVDRYSETDDPQVREARAEYYETLTDLDSVLTQLADSGADTSKLIEPGHLQDMVRYGIREN